jgi:hypothetical protein
MAVIVANARYHTQNNDFFALRVPATDPSVSGRVAKTDPKVGTTGHRYL